jgi:type I site-specific restriction endonuclease
MARPTQSTPLYIQMLGRGTRTLPPSIGNLNTKEERLEAIDASEKPYMTLMDFVDVSGDHEVVRAPSLFGMSNNFDTTTIQNREDEARIVQDVVPEVEEMVEENPFKEEQIRNAESIEEMEVEANEITVFDVAQPNDDVKEMSEYRWMEMGQGAYQLPVPADRQFDVRIEQNMLGKWDCVIHYPTQYVEQEDGSKEKVEGETFKKNEPYEELEDAIDDVDERITREHGDIRKIMKHTASWHSGQATGGQKGFLDRLGVDYPSDISKGEASALIDAKKALLRREKASA